MKNIKNCLMIGIILMTIVSSCGKSGGDKFLGTWKNNSDRMILVVTKAGDTAYSVKEIYPSQVPGFPGTSGTKTATYQDGNLVTDGSVYLSYSNGKIIRRGSEFEKTN